ncbi:3-dehydrosphinganine reductase [Cytospora paraplurivora]|uniref:3-dehydrosphinganine reductase n=1 Tax=Cytospora paraplurivora TaxID=2898453 RepID=A0AAN9TWM4_9PEZI
MGWFSHNHMPVEGQTILLTGGSEGTGLSAARIFSSEGANVIIVSRNSAKQEEAVKSIKAAARLPETQRFHTIAADVSQRNYAEGVVADATAWNDGHPPEIIWCLAGLLTPMLWTDDRALEAARYNTKHIIFTGSVLSTFAMAGHGTYAPSKFALRALADALLEGADKPQHPDVVARLAIAGIRKGRYFITTSFLGDLMRWGAMSNSLRNNWFVNTLIAWIMPFIMAFVMWDMNTQVSSWGKKEKKERS